MKKYVKPDFLYENFELSQSVAVCSFDMKNSTDVSSCTAEADPPMPGMDGIVLFADAGIGCSSEIIGSAEDYCLTNGSENFSVFNS